MNGLFGGLWDGVKTAAAMPLNALQAYGSAYASIPQAIKDAATKRQLAIEGARQQNGLIKQAAAMFGDPGADGGGSTPAVTAQPPAPAGQYVGTLADAFPSQAAGPAIQPSASSPVVPTPQTRPDLYSRARNPLALLAMADGKFEDSANILAPQIETVNGVTYDKRTVKPGTRIGVDLQNVNGTLTDMQNPQNADRFIPTPPSNGAEPVYNSRREQVGWRMMDGSIQAIRATAEAEAGGKAAGELPYVGLRAEAEAAGRGRGAAPYDLERVVGPNGETITAPRSAFLGAPVRGQTPSDAVYGSDLAKTAAGRYQALQAAGQTAQANVGKYQQFGQLLGDFDGGKLTPAGMAANSVLGSLGIKLDPKLGSKQAAEAISNQLVLSLTGGTLGANISNSDRDFMRDTAPNLKQTAEGRQILVNMATRAAQNQVKVAGMARQWQQRYGRIDAPDQNGKTFEDYLAAWTERNPIRPTGGR